MSESTKCPHCGWTPAEMRALSNTAENGRRLARAILALDSSPLQRDYVPASIQEKARALVEADRECVS